MSALQFASKLELLSLNKTDRKEEEMQKLDALTKLVSSHLE
jgi:cell division protein ZapA